MNSCANMMNSNAKVTKSITKGTKSNAKLTNSIANRTNSTAEVTNSTANRRKSIAKATNSIAKTCIISVIQKRTNSETIKLKYKAISNLVRSRTRQDTIDYISSLSASSSINSKRFWNFIKSVKGHHQPPPPLNHKGEFISDDFEKASIFNQYFNSVFTSENCSNFNSLRDSIHFHPKLIDTIKFTPKMCMRNSLICKVIRLVDLTIFQHN